jgi:phage shock protein PspC (stress-responsive transcriptional regulator)
MTDTMTDGPDGGPADGPHGGPPWTGPPNPLHDLRRSSDDRWVAGVAGGVARHFDIAPWIVRLGGIALASVGIGVPVYLVAWILLPSDTRPSIATEHGWNRNTVIAVCALVVIASLVLVGSDGIGPADHAFGWRLLPWLVIGTGMYLLIRSTTDHQPLPPPPVPMPASPTPPAPPSPYGMPMPMPVVPADDLSDGAGHGSPTTPDPTATFPTIRPTPSTPPTPSMPPREHRSPFLTPLTLFALIGLLGAAVVAGGHGWARPGVVAALAVCIIGAALIVSAVIGRARGLIAVGILMAVPLLVGMAVGPHWSDWHNRTYAPTSVSGLHRTYDRGIGRTVLDLRNLGLPNGRVTHVRIDQAIGQVVIWLPANARTTVTGHVSFGEIAYDDRADHDGGTDDRTHRTLATGDGAARIDLNLDLTAGQIRIHDDSAQPSTSTSGGN